MHLQFPKYTVLAAPGISAVLAAGFASLGRYARFFVPTLCVIFCAAFAHTAFLLLDNVKPDWQPMVTKLAQSASPGDPIIYANERGTGGDVYLYVCHYLDRVQDHPAVILSRPVDAQLEAQLRTHTRCWIVYTGNAVNLARLLPDAHVDIHAGVQNNPTIFGEVIWNNALAR